MRKSFQLLFTFLTMFIILSLGTMTDAQRKSLFCTYNVPVDTKKSCDPLCNSLCIKVYGYIGKSVCEREIKGSCQCSAFCKHSR
ncbi:hypothetical protein Bca4012_099598 [Brassica carinata]|uniref:(rape) hypothetical protein n=1 Tax=Brassica napus TaxID=3708 RepID=A0A078F3F8_BRANA|nr:unnamed protein product [Brassica napus]CDY07509.1 BnaC06g15550D [Brassica napus]